MSRQKKEFEEYEINESYKTEERDNPYGFKRKSKEERPVLAICYDFDKTLSPDDMQAQGYIQSVNYHVDRFWAESNEMARANGMDSNLAYMYKMVREAKGHFDLSRKALEEYGSKVELFPGVDEWFERVRQYGDKNGVIIEHYIISSGLKEMIEGTKIAKRGSFEEIYASAFYYDENGVAIWPAQAVNYTSKTQFLFRIEKGILDVNDTAVNDYFPADKMRVPFRNIVYIGDSDTDIPCMKLVNTYGGHSIGVYNPDTIDKKKVYKMMNDNRIKYFVPADYSEGTELDLLIKSIIDRTAYNEKLENYHYECKNEAENVNKNCIQTDEEKAKEDLIYALENSSDFISTHTIVKKLSAYNEWSSEQIKLLFEIAVSNNQVLWILKDHDIKAFYLDLLQKVDTPDDNVKKVQDIFKLEDKA